MQYLGGKSRIARRLTDIVCAHAERGTRYFEPFLGGGGSAFEYASRFSEVLMGDAHLDLMLMWQEAQRGWTPPTEVSEQLYRNLRHSPSTALRGFVGFGCSFGGKWFGGYARRSPHAAPHNYAAGASRSVCKIAARLGNADLRCVDFAEWEPSSGDTVYADPPYRGTTAYTVGFNSDRFWTRAAEWADRGVRVFVSEYEAPPGWREVWSRAADISVSGMGRRHHAATERLFVRA